MKSTNYETCAICTSFIFCAFHTVLSPKLHSIRVFGQAHVILVLIACAAKTPGEGLRFGLSLHLHPELILGCGSVIITLILAVLAPNFKFPAWLLPQNAEIWCNSSNPVRVSVPLFYYICLILLSSANLVLLRDLISIG